MSANVEHFLRGYIVCALWSSNDLDRDGENLDANYDDDDLAPATLAKMREDCEEFIRWASGDLDEYLDRITTDANEGTPEDYAGHDFWLTRERHGAGFWDRGLGEVGERLTGLAHGFGEGQTLYAGDDGLLYLM